MQSTTRNFKENLGCVCQKNSDLQPKTTENDATIYVKSGHLQHAMHVWSHKENGISKQ